MRCFHHPDTVLHQPPQFLVRGQPKPVPEKPERVAAVLDALNRRGDRLEQAPDAGPAARAAVHSPEYLAFLETAHARWMKLPDASSAVIPNVHRGPDMLSYPTSVVGQAGYHMSDTACPIAEGTWAAAKAASDCAVAAARVVASGEERAAYALCRPPGHHAGRDMAGGFCYLNHAAIAAQEALRLLAGRGLPPRVAVFDVDVHHGNGTQAIFWQRDDVSSCRSTPIRANSIPSWQGMRMSAALDGAKASTSTCRCRSGLRKTVSWRRSGTGWRRSGASRRR